MDKFTAENRTNGKLVIRSETLAPPSVNDAIGATALEVLTSNYFQIKENWGERGYTLDNPILYDTGIAEVVNNRLLGRFGWCAVLHKD